MREEAFTYFSAPFDASHLAEMVRAAMASPCWDDGIEVLSATPAWVRLAARCDISTADRLVPIPSRGQRSRHSRRNHLRFQRISSERHGIWREFRLWFAKIRSGRYRRPLEHCYIALSEVPGPGESADWGRARAVRDFREAQGLRSRRRLRRSGRRTICRHARLGKRGDYSGCHRFDESRRLGVCGYLRSRA